MRIVFMGTPQAAVPALRALAASGHDVTAVVTQPDRQGRRGAQRLPPPVKQAAAELGLPVMQPESVKTADLRAALAELRPDLFVVVAYGEILGPKLMAVARGGAVNLHFSMLPRWRGAAPVQRAILAGDTTTGVSIIRLVAQLDAGPLLASQPVEIAPGEHAPALEARLADVGARLLVETVDRLERGAVTERPQDETAITLAPPLAKSEAALDPAWPAEELERRVRALDPWPGARFDLGGRYLLVEDAAAENEPANAPPGTLLPPRRDDLPVACGGGVLLLRRVRPEGKASMTGRSLVNGRLAQPGQVLLRPVLEAP